MQCLAGSLSQFTNEHSMLVFVHVRCWSYATRRLREVIHCEGQYGVVIPWKTVPERAFVLQVLYLTNPEEWSPHATYQATRLFASNLNARMAQRFTALVLLPAVRADIAEHRRLHFALFQALRKATYKPDAFYKARRAHPGSCVDSMLELLYLCC